MDYVIKANQYAFRKLDRMNYTLLKFVTMDYVIKANQYAFPGSGTEWMNEWQTGN